MPNFTQFNYTKCNLFFILDPKAYFNVKLMLFNTESAQQTFYGGCIIMGKRIKATATEVGISQEALRYYEKKGIIKPERLANGYRSYTPEQITELKYVSVMKYAHFSLTEIATMTSLFAKPPTPECNQTSKKILSEKIEYLEDTIKHYQEIVQLLSSLPSSDDSSSYLQKKPEIDQFIETIFEQIKQTEGIEL